MVRVFYTLSNLNGIVEKNKEIPFNSFVSNFTKILHYNFNDAVSNSIKNTSGASIQLSFMGYAVTEGNLSSDNSKYGILFGDSSQNTNGFATNYNPSIPSDYTYVSDYSLNNAFNDSLINYTQTRVRVIDNYTIELSRSMINNSSSTPLYVSEFGIVVKKGTNYFLIARDVIKQNNAIKPVKVNPGQVFTVRYYFDVNKNNSYNRNFLGLLSYLFFNETDTEMKLLTPIVNINGDTISAGTVMGTASSFDRIDIAEAEEPVEYIPDDYSLRYSIPISATTQTISYKEDVSESSLYISGLFENIGSTNYTVGGYGIRLKTILGTNTHYYYIILSAIKSTPFIANDFLKIGVKLPFKTSGFSAQIENIGEE